MLVESIERGAARYGERSAIVSGDGWSLSYRDLDRLTDEAAVGLAARGIGEGDVVALLLPSTPDYLVAYGALAKLGAISAGVNPRLAPPERSVLVTDVAGAHHAIVTRDLAEGVHLPESVIELALAPDASRLLHEVRVRDATPARLPDDPDRVVAIVFTSGSTGRPKGAVFTDGRIRAAALIERGNGWGEGGPITANTQFCHVGFMVKVAAQLTDGTTTHVIDPWSATAILESVSRHRMPAVGGVAPQIAMLLRHPDFDSYDFSHTTLIVSGGAPASGALIAEARARFGADWTLRYALTETGGCGTFTPVDASEDEMLTTVGRPRAGMTVRIVDDAGRMLPAGEVGVVAMHGASIMREYWRDPEATARAFTDGFVRTGDEGFLDERGCLRLLGRRGESYSRGGDTVFPQEVEHVLGWHPAIAQVAIVPRPDDVLGAIGVAVVVPRPSAPPPTLEALRRFGAAHLARYKLPEALRIVDHLPQTAMLKVDRRALLEAEAQNTH